MAKVSSVEKNKRRARMLKQYADRRAALKVLISGKDTSPEERMAAVLKLSSLPRNSSSTRYRNRCEVTGRPRGVYRKFRMGRVILRDLASQGQIPGMVKSSW
ncbi:30S ribosomal protein S14 [Haematospirillum sp. 15-248]|uniref:30S ribosomal protein S14 n=1 Tax=Haematospirillum sp. 15-248 TaxID=2723107 RepID=UPI0014395F89|nr:30S ribosomal protein S14 [Haematospirillum sp. 15-248]NKD88468.1 30S ribosomal protein S14 [Haematospirillum sp. 15-248]